MNWPSLFERPYHFAIFHCIHNCILHIDHTEKPISKAFTNSSNTSTYCSLCSLKCQTFDTRVHLETECCGRLGRIVQWSSNIWLLNPTHLRRASFCYWNHSLFHLDCHKSYWNPLYKELYIATWLYSYGLIDFQQYIDGWMLSSIMTY